MKALNKERIAQIVANDKKSSYIRREWHTDEEDNMTLEQYAEWINPIYKYIDKKHNPMIIAKSKKNGDIFLKMEIYLTGGTTVEFELAYDNEYDEGDEIDVSTLMFCTETWLDNEHLYVTGKVVEE